MRGGVDEGLHAKKQLNKSKLSLNHRWRGLPPHPQRNSSGGQPEHSHYWQTSFGRGGRKGVGFWCRSVLNKIPQKVVDLMLQRFTIEGVVPITMDDIQECITTMFHTGPLIAINEQLAAHGAILERIERSGTGTDSNTTAHHHTTTPS
jgi:hypothetical protein